jgi:hypothetical protein
MIPFEVALAPAIDTLSISKSVAIKALAMAAAINPLVSIQNSSPNNKQWGKRNSDEQSLQMVCVSQDSFYGPRLVKKCLNSHFGESAAARRRCRQPPNGIRRLLGLVHIERDPKKDTNSIAWRNGGRIRITSRSCRRTTDCV